MAQVLEEEEDAEELFLHFAQFEEFCRETERARAIYKYALDHVPKGRADALYAKFVAFEKKHGDREHIEEVLLAQKRLQVRSHGFSDLICVLTGRSDGMH
jgi:crooked neck